MLQKAGHSALELAAQSMDVSDWVEEAGCSSEELKGIPCTRDGSEGPFF